MLNHKSCLRDCFISSQLCLCIVVSITLAKIIILHMHTRTHTHNLLCIIERIFVGRSHVARVAEARLEQINKYCQVSPPCNHAKTHSHEVAYLVEAGRDPIQECTQAHSVYKQRPDQYTLRNNNTLHGCHRNLMLHKMRAFIG